MRKITIILLLSLISTSLFAQFDLGVKGGITISGLTTNVSDITKEDILGYQGGAFIRIFLKKMILIQPEGYFTSKGGKLFTSTSEHEKEYHVGINTLDVPLCFGIKFLDLKIIKIMAYAGPVASFVTGKSLDIYQDGAEVVENQEK